MDRLADDYGFVVHRYNRDGSLNKKYELEVYLIDLAIRKITGRPPVTHTGLDISDVRRYKK